MLEVKPLSNTDYFVYPMQSCKAVDRRSVPNVIRGVVVTISTTGQGLSKPEQRKNLMRENLLKEKVKKILSQKFYIVEGLKEFSDSIKRDTS